MEILHPQLPLNAIRLRHLVAGIVLLLASFPLHANPILPGGLVSPDVFPNPVSVPPLLGDISGTFSFGSGLGLLTGTWQEAVLVDPFGITCTGCLDFVFQLTEDPLLSSGIFHTSLASFVGYTTDVGYVNGTGTAPLLVNRGPLGGGVSFIFSTLSDPTSNVIGPGGVSAFLVVATNATSYDSLGVLAISGGRGDSPANGQINGVFEPTSVPEPCTGLLLSLGLTGIAAFGKRKTN